MRRGGGSGTVSHGAGRIPAGDVGGEQTGPARPSAAFQEGSAQMSTPGGHQDHPDEELGQDPVQDPVQEPGPQRGRAGGPSHLPDHRLAAAPGAGQGHTNSSLLQTLVTITHSKPLAEQSYANKMEDAIPFLNMSVFLFFSRTT